MKMLLNGLKVFICCLIPTSFGIIEVIIIIESTLRRFMNIQIFGKKKCFDTKKAERYFKERRIKVQRIDLMSKGISLGEIQSIIKAVGFDNLVNDKAPLYEESLMPYTSDMERKKEILEEYPELLFTPIVRNGKQATIGFKPDIWQTWE